MKRPCVVIIEKDIATCEMYQRELEPVFDVYSCVNVKEAQQILSLHDINVIVLEPEGIGFDKLELLNWIKSITQTYNIPLILSSTREISDEDLKIEMAACLVKPVLPTVLSLLIRDVLQFTPMKEVIQAN